MFNYQSDQVAVLGVCVDEPDLGGQAGRIDFCSVRSARRATDMLRLLRFDLVLVGLRLPDGNTWEFVRRLRTGWAWQKWALVGGGVMGGLVADDQERTARMFGSVRIFDEMPGGAEVLTLATALRERAAQAVLKRTFDRPADVAVQPARASGLRVAAGF